MGPGISSWGSLGGVVSVWLCSYCVGELVSSVDSCVFGVIVADDSGVSVVAGVVGGAEGSVLSGGFGVRSS